MTVKKLEAAERPDPDDDPFACSICGQPLGTVARVEESDYCDACKREYGAGEYDGRQ